MPNPLGSVFAAFSHLTYQGGLEALARLNMTAHQV
jgi:hypothetical protein